MVMEYVLLVVIGLASGIVGALVGLGGGIILVPATLFIGINLGMIDGITPQSVVGLSVIMMIFTGLSSTLAYMKMKTIDFRSGFIFFIGSVPGTLLGAFVNKGLDLPSFNLYFGILLIILSILLLVRNYLKPVNWFVNHGKQQTFTDKTGETFIYGYPVWFALLLTFGVGFCFRSLWNWWRFHSCPSNDFTFPLSTACCCRHFDVHGLLIGPRQLGNTYIAWKCPMAIYNTRHSSGIYRRQNRCQIESENEIGNARYCTANHSSFTWNSIYY